jgi:hypothetical protein
MVVAIIPTIVIGIPVIPMMPISRTDIDAEVRATIIIAVISVIC